MQPVGITLHGIDPSATPITYSVVDIPLGGQLTGTAPNLIYTPAANFTGQDRFTFKVNNGTMDSRPADALITVNTSIADKTPPSVQWTYPDKAAADVKVSDTPSYSDSTGAIYIPIIAAGFSERVDPATISGATVRLTDPLGQTVSATVIYDGVGNQVLLQPRAALAKMKRYRVTLTQGIKDLAGNAISADYQWSFFTGSILYLPILFR